MFLPAQPADEARPTGLSSHGPFQLRSILDQEGSTGRAIWPVVGTLSCVCQLALTTRHGSLLFSLMIEAQTGVSRVMASAKSLPVPPTRTDELSSMRLLTSGSRA